jgi:hypothetical protein
MTALWKRGRGKKLRQLDRREAWQEVARAVGGTFMQGKRSSADSVAVGHGPWTITLDTYTVYTGQVAITYTRAKALFIGQGDPKLLVRKRNVFDTILENIGFGGVAPGDRAFAARYVVKGHPEARLRSLLTTELIAALLAESSLTVAVKKGPRKYRKAHDPQACQAAVYTTGVVTEPNRIVGLITVARETLNALEAAGMATRRIVPDA